MNSNQSVRIFILFSAIFALASSGAVVQKEKNTGTLCFNKDSRLQELQAKNPKIDYLGSFESRHFFLDRTGREHWQHSLIYCKNIGMQLINVETQAHASWLFEKLSPGTRYYWLNGHDVEDETQFKLSNGTPFKSEVRTWFRKKSCLMIHATEKGTIYNIECIGNSYVPLTICELPC